MDCEMVIAAYRPRTDIHLEPLKELLRQHNTILRVEGLITERPALLMQASDGTLVEVFEWQPGGAEAAHKHAALQKVWRRMEEVCEFAPLIALPEAEKTFPHFKPVEGVVR